jgi:hypothetical protein
MLGIIGPAVAGKIKQFERLPGNALVARRSIVPLSFPVFTVKLEPGFQVGYLEFLDDHPALG